MAQLEFTLPDVGEGLDKGMIVAWHVAVGDSVQADQILVEVETDKAIVEIPAPVTGSMQKLGGAIGDTVAVGEILVIFDTAAPTPSAGPKENRRAGHQIPTPTPQEPPPRRRVRARPATRKLAHSLNVDLTTLSGTGDRRQITRSDVLAASKTIVPEVHADAPIRPESALPTNTDKGDHSEPLSGLRRQIAINMELAWRTVPHIFTFEEVDATSLVAARDAINGERPDDAPKMSYLPFFVKACVAALKAHPRFNASIDMDNEEIVFHHRINIGIATATPEGLIVTVVHDADSKTLSEIGSEIDSLAELARTRRVNVEQIRGATFTISNYGSYGARMGTPIIRPPEVAIAGFGRIQEAVVPVNSAPAVRTILPVAMSTDHRLNDGEHLGAFFSTMIRYLSEPVRLLGT